MLVEDGREKIVPITGKMDSEFCIRVSPTLCEVVVAGLDIYCIVRNRNGIEKKRI